MTNGYSDYLQHHGVKGMHWGVRRYQNLDGTLIKGSKTEKRINERYDAKEEKLNKRHDSNASGRRMDRLAERRKIALKNAEYKEGMKLYKESKGALYEDTQRYKKYDKLYSKHDKKANIASDRFNEALLNGSTNQIHKTMKRALITSSQKAYYNDMKQRYANNLVNDTRNLKRYSKLLDKENTYGTTVINNKNVYTPTYRDSRYASAEKKKGKMRGSSNSYSNVRVPINGTPYKAKIKTPVYKQYGYIPGPIPMYYVRQKSNGVR